MIRGREEMKKELMVNGPFVVQINAFLGLLTYK